MSEVGSPEVTREIQLPPKEQEPAKPSELGMFKSLLANPEAFEAKSMDDEQKRTAKTALERQISLYRDPPKDAEELRGRLGEATTVVDMKTLQATLDRVNKMSPEQKAEILGTYEKALASIEPAPEAVAEAPEPRRSILDDFDELSEKEAPDPRIEQLDRFTENERLLAEVDRVILKQNIEKTGVGKAETILESEALQPLMSMNAEQVADSLPTVLRQMEAKMQDPNTSDAEAEKLSDEILVAKKIQEIASHIPDKTTRAAEQEVAEIDRIAAAVKAKLNDPKTSPESLDALSEKYMTALKLGEEAREDLAKLNPDPRAGEAKQTLDNITDAIRYLRHPQPERKPKEIMDMLSMDDQNGGRALIELADPDAENPVAQTHVQALENEYKKRILSVDASKLPDGALRNEIIQKQQEYKKPTE